MALTFRWLLRILTGLLVLGVLTLALLYYFGSRSLPDYNTDHSVRGLNAPLEIVRNNANVPHIFGETDHDVYFGLGYAHAQDRLWQMTMMRRTVQGRLSEIFGERTARIDELLRRLDLYNLAVQSVSVQTPETLANLRAYSAGVNAWLQQVNDQALGRGAPELFLFSNAISPWQPADSLAIIKLMGLQLAGHLEEEVLRARTSLMLPNERLNDILPDAPGAGIAALPQYASMFPDLPRYTHAAPPITDPLSPMPERGFAGASNAWAAAPSRSASGGTLLANDPHLGFTAPSQWYLARLELQSGGVIGGTIPGMPLILVGRSESFGWGITSSYLDDQDIYIEKLNPENPDEVLTPEGYVEMVSRPSILKIKDENSVTLTLQWTQNGPVLPGYLYNLGTITPQGHVASLAWTVLSPVDTSMSAAMQIMTSKTVAGGIAAAEGFIAPSQNLTLADSETIALKTIGAMPRRAALHQTQGRIPTPGWVPENRWQGRLNYSSNPEFISPQGGIVGNTNNKVVERPFPLHMSHSWGDSQRVLRWRFLMQNREVHTRESFIEAQQDEVSPTARALLPLIAKDLWFTGEAAPAGTVQRRRQDALKLLADWNGEMNEHRPEPLIYAAWMRALQDRLIRDELGPLAREYNHVEPLFIERVYRDIFGASIWCDVLQSAPVENCSDIARLALDDALLWVTETYGSALESLRWGDAHQATHDHPALGDVPILKWIVNIRQSTGGGDQTLQRGLTAGKGPEPFLRPWRGVSRGL